MSSPPPDPTPAETPVSASSLLAERGPLGFFDLNLLRREVSLSPSWKRMLGYDDTTLASTYEAWLALIHPDDTAAAPDRLTGRAPAVGSRPFSVEYRLRHAAGRYVWVHCTGVQVFGPNGSLQRVAGVHLDLQERKEAEEAALRADERLRTLTEPGRVALFDLDFTGEGTWLSPACKALLGYADDELPDTPASILRVLPPRDTPGGLADYFLQTSPGQAVCHDTLRLCHRQGHDVWAYAGYVRLFSRQRELQRVLGFLAPLPEGAVAAGPGGMAPEHLAALLEEMCEATLVTDSRGEILHLNPAAARLLGLDAADAVGRTAAEHFPLVHRDTGTPAENPLARALTLGEPTALTQEYSLAPAVAGGQPRPLVLSCRPVRDAAGGTLGAVLVFRHPGEMTLTPDELVRTNRFAGLGQLAGGLARDFDRLLGLVLGGLALARETLDPAGLEAGEKAAREAQELSRQFLAHVRGGASARSEVALPPLLADAIRFTTAGHTVPVELTAPDDLGPVLADRTQLLQVFQNLLLNSLEALPAGRGQLWVTAGHVDLARGRFLRSRPVPMSPSPCATTAAASRPNTSPACSIRSSPPNRPAPDSASRRCTPLSGATAARSASIRNSASAPPSPCFSRAPARTPGPPLRRRVPRGRARARAAYC